MSDDGLTPEQKAFESEVLGEIRSVDLNLEAIKQDIEAADSGNRDACLRLMNEFVGARRQGAVPHDEVLDYFADCFHYILGGKDPKDALGIKNPAHRDKDHDKAKRDLDYAILVAKRELSNKSKTGKKQTMLALDYVTNSLFEDPEESEKHESMVRKAWAKYRDAARLIAQLESSDT